MLKCHCIIFILINFSRVLLGCYIDFGPGSELDILVLKLNNLLWS